MDKNILMSTTDTLLIAIPFVIMLLINVFRLDQIIAAPKAALSGRQLRCGTDRFGEPILCDPDGRLSKSPRPNIDRAKLSGKVTRSAA
jgi:hypothetical protein